MEMVFVVDFGGFGHPKRVPVGPIFVDVADYCMKTMMTFRKLLEGAGGMGGVCLTMQILQDQSKVQHFRLPLLGCGESQGFAHAASPLLVGTLGFDKS